MTQFVSRETWGHPDPDNPGGGFVGVIRQPYLVEHHTPGQDPTSYDEALSELAQIYRSHVFTNGWQDIGYTFLIWGRYVFEGRGFGYTGAHAPGANAISIGVAMIMDGRFRSPTLTERTSFQWLVDVAKEHGYLSLTPKLTGHRDWVATSCPGDMAYASKDLLLVPESVQPEPQPTPSEEIHVYDFNQRLGTWPQPWKLNNIDYGPFGGAVFYDFPACAKDDVVVVSATSPDVGNLVCSVMYPSAKQSQAMESRWGHPARIPVEEAGFVTVMVEAKALGRVRIVGRSQ